MRSLLLLLFINSLGCSVLVPLFGAERCDPDEGRLISCSGDLSLATICEDRLVITRNCGGLEVCLPFEDTREARDGAAEAKYDGCGIPVDCSDGVTDIETGEECDDGNSIDTDGCLSNCQLNECGDGVINFSDSDGDGLSDETCEPRGEGDCGDNCLQGCQSDDDCLAQIPPQEQACFQSVTCNAQSDCETIPVDDTDDNDCTQQVCVIGIGPVVLLPDNIDCELPNGDDGTCLNGTCRSQGVCGDGIEELDQGEACDDGASNGADQPCLEDCSLNCALFPDQPDCGCGNGTLDAGEECDDGNAIDGDFCDSNCKVTACGNGIATPGEACDDGNNDNGDECDADCSIPQCGNGITALNAPAASNGIIEQCDDGNNANGDGCDNNCTIPGCGNGILGANEECDDGNNTNNDSCDANCKTPRCGNGIQADNGSGVAEQCDDGNTAPNDGCDTNCLDEVCGDGVIQPIEECDNGKACDNGDTCTTSADCSSGETCEPRSNDGCSVLCKAERCGDGIPQSSEECDDGNQDTDDGCGPTCLTERCGDLFLQLSEECDDGDVFGGDGCSAICQFEGCGNNIPDPGEGCDDGNPDDSDGCSASCKIEVCGDGTLQTNPLRLEECDDRNNIDGDGCNSTCLLERCGNGRLDAGETCDDGCNTSTPGICEAADSNDGCSSNCQIELCGDGIRQPNINPNESCDGNDLGGITTCAQAGFTTAGGNVSCNDSCLFDLSQCLGDVVCGDGVIQGNEQCEDGDNLSGDGCNSECRFELCGDAIIQAAIGEECDNGGANANGGTCTTTCRNARCGDGFIQTGEQCDDGNNLNDASCNADCTNPICGDGIKQANEPCDDGNQSNNDACLVNCVLPSCGDGFPQGNEQCDDNNINNNDGCSSECRTELCLDGIQQTNEECDDGNTNDLDLCRNNCTASFCGDGVQQLTEQCDLGGGNSDIGDCTLTCQNARCGDNLIHTGFEQCDDANNSNFDACNNDCTTPRCGDNISGNSANEQCDDGNTNDLDACTNACTTPRCGDGVFQPAIGEQCDNGAANSDLDPNACRIDCSFASCGDGVIDSGEACDDSNNLNDDGCSAQCTIEFCGDNIAQADELCDGADLRGFTSCDEAGLGTGTLACLANSCLFDVSGCSVQPTCGDGNIDFNEECDDGCGGNGCTLADSNDGCSATCELEACGDGIINRDGIGGPLDQCDDGNNFNDDGCNSVCVLEFCGDGNLQPILGESCDDGDEDNTDECSNDCRLPTCGDAITQPGEDCDDGCDAGLFGVCEGIDNGDGCSAVCVIEFCGDGFPNDIDEECDDANSINNDACTNACEDARCGDGIVQLFVEECDDGNNFNFDGCDLFCNNEASCGDGVIDFGAGETCDDGNIFSGDGCNGICVNEFCGDNIVNNLIETCDDGNIFIGDGCSNCQIENPICGNSITEAGETCDDGDLILNDECPDGPSGSCQPAVCGDGFVFNQGPGNNEECDFNAFPLDPNCDASCQLINQGDACPPADPINISDFGFSTFANNAAGTSSEGGSCGGSGAPEDAYQLSLTQPLSPGQSIQISVNNQSTSFMAVYARRGSCDDPSLPNEIACNPLSSFGNTNILISEVQISGDTELFLFVDTILGSPGGGYSLSVSVLGVASICGDNIPQFPEQCDNGFFNSDTEPNACRTDCTNPSCGDNVQDTIEQCDDGNLNSNDGCSSTCFIDGACAGAVPIFAGNPTSNATSQPSASPGPESLNCPIAQDGGERIFRLSLVNAIGSIEAILVPSDQNNDMSVAIKIGSCNNAFDACNDLVTLPQNIETVISSALPPFFTGNVFIFVDSKASVAPESFTLTVNLLP